MALAVRGIGDAVQVPEDVKEFLLDYPRRVCPLDKIYPLASLGFDCKQYKDHSGANQYDPKITKSPPAKTQYNLMLQKKYKEWLKSLSRGDYANLTYDHIDAFLLKHDISIPMLHTANEVNATIQYLMNHTRAPCAIDNNKHLDLERLGFKCSGNRSTADFSNENIIKFANLKKALMKQVSDGDKENFIAEKLGRRWQQDHFDEARMGGSYPVRILPDGTSTGTDFPRW